MIPTSEYWETFDFLCLNVLSVKWPSINIYMPAINILFLYSSNQVQNLDVNFIYYSMRLLSNSCEHKFEDLLIWMPIYSPLLVKPLIALIWMNVMYSYVWWTYFVYFFKHWIFNMHNRKKIRIVMVVIVCGTFWFISYEDSSLLHNHITALLSKRSIILRFVVLYI